MIRIVVKSVDGPVQDAPIESLEHFLAQPSDQPTFVWVDMLSPEPDEEQLILSDVFKFHPLAILDCQRERLNRERGDHLPKVEDFGRYLFAIVNPIDTDPDDPAALRGHELHTRQLNTFLGERFIVTHHYEPSPAVESVFAACHHNDHMITRGPDFLYHMVLDHIVDQYNPMLDRLDTEVDRLEDEVFAEPTDDTLMNILALKRNAFAIRRIITYQREMVHRLSRGEYALITDDEIAYYRNVYDHLERAFFLTESHREEITGLLDAHLAMQSNRMNEVMKILTMFSTFFLPLTFIAGLYGMNFQTTTSRWNMPELRWQFGYPFAWGLMLAVGVAMFLYFRKRKWL